MNHQAERYNLDQRFIDEMNDFWAESSLSPSDLPNTGFATLMIPLTAIAMEAVHARSMGMLDALDELVLTHLADKYDHLRTSSDKFWNEQFRNKLNFREKIESATLEQKKHGTGVISVGYREIKRNRVTIKEGREIDIPVYLEKGTCIDSVPISDFLMPFSSTDSDKAPWCGNYVRMTERDVLHYEAAGIFYPGTYEKLRGAFTQGSSDGDIVLTEVRKETDTEPTLPTEIKFVRIFCEYIMEDKEVYEVEVYYQPDTQVLAHCSYSDERPYVHDVYMPLENRWYGYGIAKQNREFQVEVTTQHRQRIDNATIANMSMFKVKNSARAYIKDDEPIFPGKKFYVENMDDIQPLQIGDVKASAYNNENQVVIYSQQRTGVNELTLGMPNVGTPGTATDSAARVQESNRKFDYTHNNTKRFLNKVAYKAAQYIIKHEDYDSTIFSYLANGSELESLLKQKELLTKKFIFDIYLSGAKNNKVLDRNTYTQLVGMHTQYCTSALELLGQMNPAYIEPAGKQILMSNNILYKQILNAFDIPNPDKLILNFEAIFNAAPPQEQGQLQQATNPGVPGVGQGSPSGPTSLMAPGANINFNGGPPPLQLLGGAQSY